MTPLGTLALLAAGYGEAGAMTVQFFDPAQVASPVASGDTWDVVSCSGYAFTYTRDKLFTGGIGTEPIGRPVRVSWPEGVEAQAVTAGPNPSKARITIERVDGAVFDLAAFTSRLLANTSGAGGSIEVMPKLGGEDAWNDPAYFMASGSSGLSFSYDTTTPSYLGNTSLLKNFESYAVTLYVDFAMTAITLEDASASQAGDFDADGDVDGGDFLMWQRGESPEPLSAGDFDAWRTNFGTAPALVSGAGSAPEPAAWLLALVAAGATPLARTRRASGVAAED